jgi:predicted nucleic acid-binding Zn ribbon protein
MPFCPHCGQELPEGISFCTRCGKAVTLYIPRRRSRRRYWVLILVLLFIAGGIIEGYHFFPRKTSERLTRQTSQRLVGKYICVKEDKYGYFSKGATLEFTSQGNVVLEVHLIGIVGGSFSVNKENIELKVPLLGSLYVWRGRIEGDTVIFEDGAEFVKMGGRNMLPREKTPQRNPEIFVKSPPPPPTSMREEKEPISPPPQQVKPKVSIIPSPASGAGICPDSQWRKLTEDDLKGKSAWELDIMRNEIYARHGRPFKIAKYRDYFLKQSWYKENPNFRDDQLSQIERYNAWFILKYQKRTGLTTD